MISSGVFREISGSPQLRGTKKAVWFEKKVQ
jgi:hypothetical protein